MKTNDLTHTPRERTSVFITGVDTSTPDDLVKDGMCEELHNMRYEGSAWRPVHEHVQKVNMNAQRDVVYHHPAAGENTYITMQRQGPNYVYYSSTFAPNTTSAPMELIASFTTEQKISHFGNVLMFSDGQKVSYYLLTNNKYIAWSRPNYAKTTLNEYTYYGLVPSAMRIADTVGEHVAGDWISYEDFRSLGTDKKATAAWFPFYNLTQGVSTIENTQNNAWHGELLLFTTFTLKDGTNISPSPLHLIKSNKGYEENTGVIVRRIGQSKEPAVVFGAKDEKSSDTFLAITMSDSTRKGVTISEFYEPSLASCIAKVDIEHSLTEEQKKLVESVSVWVTRINPIYRYSPDDNQYKRGDNEMFDIFNYHGVAINRGRRGNVGLLTPETPSSWRDNSGVNAASFIDYYADNELASQTFYLLEELYLDDFTENKATITLTKQKLSSAIHNKKYTPNNFVHDIVPYVNIDYNNSLHNANNTLVLFEGYSFNDVIKSGTDFVNAWVNIELDNAQYYVQSLMRYNPLGSINSNVPFTHVISYPDFRAKYIYTQPYETFLLKEATANNVAWVHEPHTEAEKFPPLSYTFRSTIESPPPFNAESVVHQPNRIQVSSPNNPFSFPFDTSYSVGSANNRILALQSAAIEMHEMKVGELPLYAFTEEGIFALVAGAETLYASVAAINYDKIINPNTLAINGAIVYITEKGVHLLTTSGTQIISTPIHGANGMPPLDFLRTCKILWPKQYNDIVLFNEAYSKAYVYNLDAGYWSTRDLVGKKINTDELVNGQYILDLADEDESKALPCRITTRPIKLGDVEFKRLETIIPRMATNDKMVVFAMDVDGSVDGYSYSELRKDIAEELESHRVNPITLRRTPFSAKYFKCHMLMEPEQGESFNPSITHIDFEWYRKLRHRMR